MSPVSTPELLLELYCYRVIADWPAVDREVTATVKHRGITCTVTIRPAGIPIIHFDGATCLADVVAVLHCDRGMTVGQIETVLSDAGNEWSRRQIERALADLVASGRVIAPGLGKRTGYRLTADKDPTSDNCR